MRHTKLSDHKFSKGKFITPLNAIPNLYSQASWFYDRMPEYLWLGLILQKYGRAQGFLECRYIIDELLKRKPELTVPKFSDIFQLPENIQFEYFTLIANHIGKEVLAPLTVLFPYTYNKPFSIVFNVPGLAIQERMESLNKIMKITSGHQENFSTDIRFLVVYTSMAAGKLVFLQKTAGSLELIRKYPNMSHDDELMKEARSAVRAIELTASRPLDMSHFSKMYLEYFWKETGKMTHCDIHYFEFEDQSDDSKVYLEKVKEIITYYSEVFTSILPTDNKILTLLGIVTYSYKMVVELCEHDLSDKISGRLISRILVENYLQMKYLLSIEEKGARDVWLEFQSYGVGQYKLIKKRYEEKINQAEIVLPSQFNHAMIDSLVNEYRDEEFINMDTSYFDRKSVRDKAKNVNEQDMFGLLYDYGSTYVHGFWGAIRESSLLKCTAPGHHYHCVPDLNCSQNLSSVWEDCKSTIKKMLILLSEEYGLPGYFEIEDL